MPFCTQCGTQVGAGDAFCAGCGFKQGGADGKGNAAPGGASTSGTAWKAGPKDFAGGVPPRTVAALCYVPGLGWLSSLYVLAGERFRQDQTVRFHAFQGLYLFVGWLLVGALGPMFNGGWRLNGIMRTVLSVLGVIMMVKTLRNQDERLPFVGELADRSIREQR
jgi:uncharacterized membrane protein